MYAGREPQKGGGGGLAGSGKLYLSVRQRQLQVASCSSAALAPSQSDACKAGQTAQRLPFAEKRFKL